MPFVSYDSLINSVYSRIEWNTAFYPQQEVEQAILDAIREFNVATGIFRGSSQFETEAGKSVYSLTNNLIIPISVWASGKVVHRTSLKSLALLNEKWAEERGDRPQFWCPMGVSRIILYPTPVYGGVTIQAEGICEVPDDIDGVDIPHEYAALIIDLAWHRLPMKEGGMPFRAAAERYSEYTKKLSEIILWKSAKVSRYKMMAEV